MVARWEWELLGGSRAMYRCIPRQRGHGEEFSYPGIPAKPGDDSCTTHLRRYSNARTRETESKQLQILFLLQQVS